MSDTDSADAAAGSVDRSGRVKGARNSDGSLGGSSDVNLDSPNNLLQTESSTRIVTREMWPALNSTPQQVLSLVNSQVAKAVSSTSPSDQSLPHCWSERETSTDRVEQMFGNAFDRLWRNRPIGLMGMPIQDSDPDSVDGYISCYFHHVAELSRESVYQAHQRKMLNQMRDDLIAGDRSGSVRELDERIQRSEENDQFLQTEIANRMRIVDREGICCCGGRGRLLPRTGCCAPQQKENAGREVEGCRADCALQ